MAIRRFLIAIILSVLKCTLLMAIILSVLRLTASDGDYIVCP
jgi:hypothetical protein